MHRLSRRGIILVACDTILIVAAVVVAAYIRLGEFAQDVVVEEHGILKTLLLASVVQLSLYYSDLYDLRVVADRRELFLRILQALGAAAFALAVLYYWVPAMIIGRGVFGIAAGFVFALVAGWRLAFDWLGRQIAPRERLLIVGTSSSALSLARELFDRRGELGVSIVGFVDPDPSKVGQPLINPGIVGTVEDIPAIVKSRKVDRVVVSLADARGKLPMDKLLDMKIAGVSFDHLASVYEEYTGKISVENLRPSWLIFSSGFRKSHALEAAKRATDIMAAVIGLTVALPIMLVVGALVRLTSRGPVLFHQARVGRSGSLFKVHKFRSMRADAEAMTGPVWAQAADPRVTPIGRFLRKTRLDELPQLWNVLVGEMSVVGPRPERPEFVEDLTREIPYYGQRHAVRPGLTGWAQVRYRYGASREDALEKLQYELFYIKNLSIARDIVIMLQTIKTVLLRRGT